MRQLTRRAVVGGLAGLGAFVAEVGFVGGCGRLPVGPSAQSPVRRVGLLAVPSRADSEDQMRTFYERAHELGWIEGQTMVVEERWGNGQRDAIPQLAAELARLP